MNKNDIMSSKGIEIAIDFQGWPIYKRNWRYIFERLGAIREDGTIIIDKDDPILDTFPEVMEDDGMGYSPNIKWISDVFQKGDSKDVFQIWIDLETPEQIKPKRYLYYKMGWPEVQEFMEDYYDEIYFDSTKNCWFVPEYLVN